MSTRLTKVRLVVVIIAVVALVPATAMGSHIFDDVPDTKFFADPVEWAAKYGITTGTGPNTFDPDRAVTRGETVTFLNRYHNNIGPRLATVAANDIVFNAVPGDIPDMAVDVDVPAGGSWLALITFSAESRCAQDPVGSVFCGVQAVLDTAAGVCGPPLPAGCINPGGVVFDSIQHSANSTDIDGWGTHSFQWIEELAPGSHTITMQWAVDEIPASFTMGARTLSVLLLPV